MRQCLGAGQNVILSGDTGTGKSELLESFALLVNAGSKHIPDNVDESFKFAIKMKIVPDSLAGLRDVSSKRKAILDGIETICSNTGNLPKLREAVASFVKSHLEKYKLLKGSDFMCEIVQAVNEVDPMKRNIKIEGLLKTKEEIIKTFNDIWTCRMEEVFYRLQMHQHITPEMFREMVSRVVMSAEKVKKLGDDLKVVGFIDECTSTSVMGMVKEVLVDKTLNGVPLPKNVMWVGGYKKSVAEAQEEGHDEARPPPPSFGLLELLLH